MVVTLEIWYFFLTCFCGILRGEDLLECLGDEVTDQSPTILSTVQSSHKYMLPYLANPGNLNRRQEIMNHEQINVSTG